MPSVPDFETLFSQVQLFISTCNGEHIRYATDTCKLNTTLFISYQMHFACVVIDVVHVLSLLSLVAGLCHQLTNALVERKQVSNVIQVFMVTFQEIANEHNDLIA